MSTSKVVLETEEEHVPPVEGGIYTKVASGTICSRVINII